MVLQLHVSVLQAQQGRCCAKIRGAVAGAQGPMVADSGG
jgi:hypothetical protein